MLYIFLITAFLDGVYLLPVLDTCADVVALMIMTSPGPSPGPGRYNIQALKRLLPTSFATSATSEPAGFLSTLTSPGSSSKTAHSYASLIHNSDPWIIDSGASKHMTGNFKFFTSYSPLSGRDKVKVADGSLSPILGKG